MTTLRAICTACAPASLERAPTRPTAHRTVSRALRTCRRGHDGHRRSPCHSWGGHHRVQHAWGHRHCPPCPPHTTPQWFPHHLEHQLPGPPCLLTCTVPATRRPCLRSPHRLASHALCTASAEARTRRATAERCLGTERPGFPAVLPTWGRQRQSPPHLHASVPGGGRSADRTTWRTSRAHCLVPVQARSPISRAMGTEAMRHANVLEQSDPRGWTIPWHVHRQATPHAHAALTSLAPSGCTVALAQSRIGSRTDRPVTVTSRQPGSARPRTTRRDALECLRRVLQHVLPDGCLNVRHGGLLHASGAVPPETIRLLSRQGHPSDGQPPPPRPPPPLVVRWPTCDVPLHVVMRVRTSPRAWVDTGEAAGLCPGNRGATRLVTPTAPVRLHPGITAPTPPDAGRATAFQPPADGSLGSSEAPVPMPHPGVRCPLPARA
jgi:hypothetical protein